MRYFNKEARKRGIHLIFGAYTMGYGLSAHTFGKHFGKVYKNIKNYPYGEEYDCLGTYISDKNKNNGVPYITGRRFGTCLSNEAMMTDKLKELCNFIMDYQDKESSLWYQVVDKGHFEGNWLESSCSMLFTYAAAKGVRMGIVDSKYIENAKKGFESIIERFTEIKDGDLFLSGVCVGTGVLPDEDYLARPTSINDLHGMGAFLLMCAEIAQMK